MVFLTKSSSNNKNSNTNNEGWGMGFLLILFHHHPNDDTNNSNCQQNHLFSKRSKSSFSLSSTIGSKSTNLLLSKTQSTLSICGLLVFATLLLFTLSTFEPTSVVHHKGVRSHLAPSRRSLREGKDYEHATRKGLSISRLFENELKSERDNKLLTTRIASPSPAALQGMGMLYLRGSKAMTDLIVGHVPEETSKKEVTTFFRAVLHSGILSRADFVLVYASPQMAAALSPVIRRECDRFVRLVHLSKFTEPAGLNYPLARYLKGISEGDKEPMWGKKKGNSTESDSTQSSYGSVVGFEVSELDPEDSLSGFLDHVPMSFRRWAGYPMLLGRVRRQFKHTMLVNVKTTLVLSDPFTRVRNKTTESLYLWSNPDAEPLPQASRHRGKRNSDKDNTHSGAPRARQAHAHSSQTHYSIDAVVGGSRGVRRFATAAHTEIVRAVVERKGKGGRNPVTEPGLVNQLVHSGHLLKSVNLITPSESIPELSSLAGLNSGNDSVSSILKLTEYFSVVQRGHSNGVSGSFDIDNAVIKEICASHKLYSSVYSDCLVSQ